MRRVLIALAALIVIVVAGAVLLTQTVSPHTIQQEVARHASRLSGFDVRIDGDTRFSLWPAIGFNIRNVTLTGHDSNTPVAVMDELDGTVKILPLLSGEVVVSSFRLVRPKITLYRGTGGRTNWQTGSAGSVEKAVDTQAAAPGNGNTAVRVGVVEISEGTVVYQDASGGHLNLTGINGSLTWPNAQAPATAAGSLIWNGSAIEFTGRVAEPLAFMGSGKSAFTAALSSSLGQLKLEGSANTRAEFQFNGTADLRSGKLRALLSWLNVPVGAGPGLNDAVLTGSVNLVGGNAALSNLKMRIDNTNAEGAVKIGRTAGLTTIQGTLAADAVDLGRYQNPAPQGDPARQGQPGATERGGRTLDLTGLKGFDIDLRLSAASVKLGKAAISRTAVSLTAREGKFQIAIGEADIFGGRASGTISGTTAASGNLPMMTSFQAKGIQAAPLLDALDLPPRLTGKIDMTFNADGNGANGARFMRTMNGQAKIDVANAVLSGVDLRRAIELVFDPAKAAQTQASSQTALTSINGSFTIKNGVSSTNDLVLTGNQLKISLNGSHDIPSGALDGSGVAEIGAAAQGGQAPLAIPFRLGGTVAAPKIAPDAAWLLDLNNPDSRQKLQDSAKTLLKNGIGKLFERNKQ